MSGRTLNLRPIGARSKLSLAITLPTLLPGLDYTKVVVGTSTATLSFHAAEVSLRPRSS